MRLTDHIKRLCFIAALMPCALYGQGQNLSEAAKQLSVFNSIYKTLEQYYVDTLDAQKCISTAVRAMLADLDPYTEYYEPKEAKDFTTMTTGKYAGVGALIHYYKKADRCIIQQLYEGQPAAMAGLRDGDIIMSVNGKDFGTKGDKKTETYVSEVSSALRGDPGTVAKVRVQRPGVDDEMEFDVVRAYVQLSPVPCSAMVDNEVGYIYLSSFTTNCSQDVLEALRDLKARGAKALVLDVRNNGGGLANEAVKIVNLFVPRGKLILKMKGKYADANVSYATQNQPEDTEIPLVVLVNGSSASASEITCGALQDLDRAVVMGERTFGKGLVQQPRELPGDGMLKLTTSHYYIPSGRCIQALDYSHKSTDGEVYRTPDSLTHVFYTEAGRPVRDGGGITPDVEVKVDTISTLVAYLSVSDEYFDYVTKYCNEHPTIAPAREFVFDDKDYDDFVQFIVDSKFSPEYQSARQLQSLERLCRAEEMPESTFQKLKELEESMKPDMAEVLPRYKQELIERLTADITDRYYYNSGAIESQFKYDTQLKAAVELLKSDEYNRLLTNENEK